MKFLIHFLCIFAVMSATISPACAFISGKSGAWIEICSGMNIVKVQVADDEIPDMTQQSYEFCFQHTNIAGVGVSVSLINPIVSKASFGDFITETAIIQFHKVRHARAPPFFS